MTEPFQKPPHASIEDDLFGRYLDSTRDHNAVAAVVAQRRKAERSGRSDQDPARLRDRRSSADAAVEREGAAALRH